MIIKDNMANMCAKVTSTYMEFTLAFGPKPEFSFSFKCKKKSVRITRAGVYLKPALVQCAHAAVKSDKSPYYKKKYESLVKRRGKKRAIIAIARMILTAIFQMLTTGETWNPCDLYKIDMPEALLEKQKQKAIKQAQKLLIREGLLPPTEPIAS